MPLNLEPLTRRIAATATQRDLDGQWPVEVLEALRDAEALKFAIPAEFGGLALSAHDQVLAYEAVARGSVAAALILTQHDGACGLIARSESFARRGEMLRDIAAHQRLTSVGISQLTTSQRGDGPPMQAVRTDGGYRFNGVMPWVTSAGHCDWIVVGAVVMEDGKPREDGQLLAVIPTDIDGLTMPSEPMALAALQPSWTAAIRCDNLFVADDAVLRGPAASVLSARGPVKSLTVTAVGVGLAGAIVASLNEIAARRSADFAPFCDAVEAEYQSVRQALLDAARQRGGDPDAEVPAESLRSRCNAMLARLSWLHMTLRKGTGLRVDRPAQRWMREASFFLVWSAPKSVQIQTLELLAGGGKSRESNATD